MKVIDTAIPDVKIIEPRVFEDSRGYFFESFNQDEFENKMGFACNFVQDNESLSTFGTLRGLHFQRHPFAQDKLVRVIQGRVWDVAVDLRLDSETYKNWVGIELSGESKQQLFIPRGFGHGFLVLSKTAVFAYKVSAFYLKSHDSGVKFNDPDLAIEWPLSETQYIISNKDKELPLLKDCQLDE